MKNIMLNKNSVFRFKQISRALITAAGVIAFSSAVEAATFVPSSGRLLVIGQDTQSITGYSDNLGAVGGNSVYISIDNLSGLTTTVDNGAGQNNAATLVSLYPNSALLVAVYAVNQLGNINNGSLDAKIDSMINTLKGFNRPVYLLFGYEFDGAWNSYDPAQFKSAWTRIWNRVDALNARNNISMVWHSSTYCGGTYLGHPFSDWYPGDSYVDMVAVSYFGASGCNYSAVDAVANFAHAHGKQVMIAESTPQGYAIGASTWRSTDGSNNTPPRYADTTEIWGWYTNFFNWINRQDVKIVTYINANWNAQSMWAAPYSQGYWGDSRVQANSVILNNWSSATSGYLKASSTLFSILGFGSTSSAASSAASSVTSSAASSSKSSSTASSAASGTVFGLSSTGVAYHKVGTQTASWVYLCLNSDCRAATKNGTRWEYQFSVAAGTAYQMTYKVQDNATGQCIANAANITPGGGVSTSVCL
jgi:hypothetical protein